jgi:hypothetical protein
MQLNWQSLLHLEYINGQRNRTETPFPFSTTWCAITISLNKPLQLYFMDQCRADKPVPAVEHGIEEVFIQHRKTKHGFQTTEKCVPVLIPVKDKLGQPSHSKGGLKGISDLEQAEGSQVIPPMIDDVSLHKCADEHIYDHPYGDMENDQYQANVCLLSHPLFIYNQKLSWMKSIMEQWIEL